MKKIALCLYGKFNNRLSETSGIEGFEYITEHILNNRNVDVFIHSWDLENQKVIEECYGKNIVAANFQEQIDFQKVVEAEKIDESAFKTPAGQVFRTIPNSLSFFYSRGQSIELKKAYEEKNNFTYDIVISSRFDLGQLDKYNGYQSFKTSEIVFNENEDMNYIYSAMWDQLNAGYADMWFYSSSQNMDTLGTMYQRSLKYYQLGSEYIKKLTTGWPDSNQNDEFSNELLKPVKSTQLKTHQIFEAHNNHIMHKWFFIDSGLYEKSKFLAVPATKFCTIMYSHSDYSDIWPLYFGQNEKHSRPLGKNFIFVNKKMDGVPSDYEQIIYDEKKTYPERLIQCLTALKERNFEACLFEHEDMVLYNDIDYSQVKIAINHVLKKKNRHFLRNDFDYIRLIKSTNSYSIRSFSNKALHWMLPISRWLFSVQPSIWKIDSYIKMLRPNVKCNIWELELKAQSTCRRLGLRCGYVHTDGKKRGLHHWDNTIYPYIATAIVKGKWNISEYQESLPGLLKEYNIDVNARGAN